MEFIIIIAVIIVCCLILNVNMNYILFGLAILMCGIFALMAIFFVYSIIKLACSKPKEARFVRFDKTKNSKVQMAYYLVEDEEYPCFFPKEYPSGIRLLWKTASGIHKPVLPMHKIINLPLIEYSSLFYKEL